MNFGREDNTMTKKERAAAVTDCTARSPKCEGCPLGAVCPSYPIAK